MEEVWGIVECFARSTFGVIVRAVALRVDKASDAFIIIFYHSFHAALFILHAAQ